MKKTVSNKCYFFQYRDITSFQRDIENKPAAGAFVGAELQSACTYYSYFYGTNDFADACNRFRFGDKENIDKMTAAGLNFATNAKTGNVNRMRQYNSVVGFIPNVPNYLNGIPESMINLKRVSCKGSKVITIAYLNNYNGGYNANDIVPSNVAFVSAILGLEKKGYKVNLYVGNAATCKNESYCVMVKVKDSGRIFDKSKLAYPLINPSFKRRQIWRKLETCGVKNKKWTSGYGCPMSQENFVKTLQENNFKYDFALSFEQIENLTAEQIVANYLTK